MNRPISSIRGMAVSAVVLLFAAAGAQAVAFPDPAYPAAAAAEVLSELPFDLEFGPDTVEFSDGASRIAELTPEQAAKAVLLNCTIYCGTTVSYTSWRGNVTTMQEYRGLHVRLLVPQSWYGEATFTESMRHMLVDGFDIVYQYYVEIVGRRAGSGLDTIAFVSPVGCGSACGSVGGHGVELGVDYGYYVTNGPGGGLQAYAAIHEMGHNFDSYGRSYKFPGLPDPSHYWTTIMRVIYRYVGAANQYYDRDYYRAVYNYLQLPAGAASWQNCVIQNQSSCSGASGYSAPVGLFFRITSLYGQGSIMRWMAFMRSMDSAQATPNDQAKLDHFFEGFSVAANRNVNCALDELRWPISSNVRTWVDTNIGTVQQNPDCAIGANGKSRLLDMHAEFWAPTTANNRSDVNGAGFTSLATVAYPGTINSHGNDRTQSLRVDGVAGQAVTYYFCSPPGGYAGGVLIWRGGTGIDGPGFTPGRCNSTVLTPAANAIPWFEVRSGSGNSAGNHGAFSIVAAPAPPSAWLSRDWGRLAVVQSSVTGEFTMTVSAVDASKVTPSSSIFPGPRKVRFWAENYGWVAEVPWTAGATTYVARWTPPAGAPPGIEFRAQVYANAQHGYASQQTRPVLFRDLIFRNGFQ